MRMEYWSSLCFAMAILHTFCAGKFSEIANRSPSGSVKENAFHLLGEVEAVFGIWAAIFCIGFTLTVGTQPAIAFLESLKFTEPLFVFAIMTIAATAPVLRLAEKVLLSVSRVLPFEKNPSLLVTCMVAGPLMGSLITEPAAMTVTALILKKQFFDSKPSQKFMYACLGVLFVNISIGGTLTHFAAPPVLMVAKTWNWDLMFMLKTFGWKAAFAVLMNAILLSIFLKDELRSFNEKLPETSRQIPYWVIGIHIAFLVTLVVFAHHPVVFIGALLFFLGFANVTREYQTPLQLRQSLLVAFFLAGLVVLGAHQSWWLSPLLNNMTSTAVYFAATALTAFTDNAALTYLGSQIADLSESFQYFLVAGAVAGGGLTVIANAPNPAGHSILQSAFGSKGISASRLFVHALLPTLIALLCFGLL